MDVVLPIQKSSKKERSIRITRRHLSTLKELNIQLSKYTSDQYGVLYGISPHPAHLTRWGEHGNAVNFSHRQWDRYDEYVGLRNRRNNLLYLIYNNCKVNQVSLPSGWCHHGLDWFSTTLSFEYSSGLSF